MERPNAIAVVDATVAVKWFVEEEFTKEALAMMNDYEGRKVDLRSTQLMPFEVLNALRYNPEMGRSEMAAAGDALSRFRIALYPVLGDLKDLSIRTATEGGLTIYDASYVSLGELLGCSVYTTDTKLLGKAKGIGRVRHVKDYPAS